MWKLVIEDDEGKRTVVHLTRDHYTVGRKEGNAIRLTERNVSRDHCKLTKGGDGSADAYTLDDVDSYNGVFVNGIRLTKPQEMVHGDLIQIGDYRVVIQDDAVQDVSTDGAGQEVDAEDLKATLVPGRGRARGTLLLERPNRFVMLIGPTPGAEYPLDKERITIGRAEEATISVNHNSVSRMHCEVHKLAEGRYEIVDKGSSNGVRVNGSDLSRGIVEAGDVIELGDVRFKFVAAGQVFLANASDSQQLAAITDRDAQALAGSGSSKKSSMIPYVVLGLVIGCAAVGGVLLATRPTTAQRPDVPEVTPATTITDAERTVLGDARRLSLTNPGAAHLKVITEIPVGSPARNANEFLEIENRWAEDAFARAKREQDHDTAIAILKEVTDSTSVGAANQQKARELIQARFSGGTTPPHDAAPTGPDAAGSTSPGSSAVPTPSDAPHTANGNGRKTPVNNTSTPAHTTTAPATKPAAATKQSLAQRARDKITQGDVAGARALLQPGLNKGTASAEERAILRSICKSQGDQACVKQIDGK